MLAVLKLVVHDKKKQKNSSDDSWEVVKTNLAAIFIKKR